MAANIDFGESSEESGDRTIASLPSRVEKLRLLPPGPDDPVCVSLEKLFAVEMVRDCILAYAIQDKNSLCLKTISNLRLVNKTWNTAVINAVHTIGLPMRKLNFVSQKDLIDKTDSFIALTSARIHQQKIPTFSLDISSKFFFQENYDILLKYLVCLGTGLVSLFVEMPSCGGLFPCVFPNLSLPVLKTFGFGISTLNPGKNEVELADSLNFTSFIQSVFNGSHSLKEFWFINDGSKPPLGITCLKLPETIKIMGFLSPLNIAKTHTPLLKILDRSELQNLEKLCLQIPLSSSGLNDDSLFKVLDRFKTSLRVLQLVDGFTQSCVEINKKTYIKVLPLMPKLSSLYIFSQHLEPKIDCPSTYFPNITFLGLGNQLYSGLTKWLGNSRYENVVRLVLLSESNTQLDETNKLTLNTMQMVGKACPGLRELVLKFFEFEEDSIRYVFSEMRNLGFLSIRLTGCSSNSNQDFWDAVLIGCSPEVASAVRANLGLFRYLQFVHYSTPSVSSMQDLHTLELQSKDEKEPLISDLVFHICLLKMTNLNNLTLEGGFKASDEMAQKWRSLNRKLNCNT